MSWWTDRPFKKCSSCLKVRKIYLLNKNLCSYCATKNYALKYHKQHPEIYRGALYKWREKTGKNSNVYQHKYNYAGNRELVIQRDKEKCVKCGLTRIEQKKKSGRDLSVDHINGIGKYDSLGGRRNKPSELQTLCSSCHMKKTFSAIKNST